MAQEINEELTRKQLEALAKRYWKKVQAGEVDPAVVEGTTEVPSDVLTSIEVATQLAETALAPVHERQKEVARHERDERWNFYRQEAYRKSVNEGAPDVARTILAGRRPPSNVPPAQRRTARAFRFIDGYPMTPRGLKEKANQFAESLDSGLEHLKNTYGIAILDPYNKKNKEKLLLPGYSLRPLEAFSKIKAKGWEKKLLQFNFDYEHSPIGLRSKGQLRVLARNKELLRAIDHRRKKHRSPINIVGLALDLAELGVALLISYIREAIGRALMLLREDAKIFTADGIKLRNFFVKLSKVFNDKEPFLERDLKGIFTSDTFNPLEKGFLMFNYRVTQAREILGESGKFIGTLTKGVARGGGLGLIELIASGGNVNLSFGVFALQTLPYIFKKFPENLWFSKGRDGSFHYIGRAARGLTPRLISTEVRGLGDITNRIASRPDFYIRGQMWSEKAAHWWAKYAGERGPRFTLREEMALMGKAAPADIFAEASKAIRTEFDTKASVEKIRAGGFDQVQSRGMIDQQEKLYRGWVRGEHVGRLSPEEIVHYQTLAENELRSGVVGIQDISNLATDGTVAREVCKRVFPTGVTQHVPEGGSLQLWLQQGKNESDLVDEYMRNYGEDFERYLTDADYRSLQGDFEALAKEGGHPTISDVVSRIHTDGEFRAWIDEDPAHLMRLRVEYLSRVKREIQNRIRSPRFNINDISTYADKSGKINEAIEHVEKAQQSFDDWIHQDPSNLNNLVDDVARVDDRVFRSFLGKGDYTAVEREIEQMPASSTIANDAIDAGRRGEFQQWLQEGNNHEELATGRNLFIRGETSQAIQDGRFATGMLEEYSRTGSAASAAYGYIKATNTNVSSGQVISNPIQDQQAFQQWLKEGNNLSRLAEEVGRQRIYILQDSIRKGITSGTYDVRSFTDLATPGSALEEISHLSPQNVPTWYAQVDANGETNLDKVSRELANHSAVPARIMQAPRAQLISEIAQRARENVIDRTFLNSIPNSGATLDAATGRYLTVQEWMERELTNPTGILNHVDFSARAYLASQGIDGSGDVGNIYQNPRGIINSAVDGKHPYGSFLSPLADGGTAAIILANFIPPQYALLAGIGMGTSQAIFGKLINAALDKTFAPIREFSFKVAGRIDEIVGVVGKVGMEGLNAVWYFSEAQDTPFGPYGVMVEGWKEVGHGWTDVSNGFSSGNMLLAAQGGFEMITGGFQVASVGFGAYGIYSLTAGAAGLLARIPLLAFIDAPVVGLVFTAGVFLADTLTGGAASKFLLDRLKDIGLFAWQHGLSDLVQNLVVNHLGVVLAAAAGTIIGAIAGSTVLWFLGPLGTFIGAGVGEAAGIYFWYHGAGAAIEGLYKAAENAISTLTTLFGLFGILLRTFTGGSYNFLKAAFGFFLSGFTGGLAFIALFINFNAPTTAVGITGTTFGQLQGATGCPYASSIINADSSTTTFTKAHPGEQCDNGNQKGSTYPYHLHELGADIIPDNGNTMSIYSPVDGVITEMVPGGTQDPLQLCGKGGTPIGGRIVIDISAQDLGESAAQTSILPSDIILTINHVEPDPTVYAAFQKAKAAGSFLPVSSGSTQVIGREDDTTDESSGKVAYNAKCWTGPHAYFVYSYIKMNKDAKGNLNFANPYTKLYDSTQLSTGGTYLCPAFNAFTQLNQCFVADSGQSAYAPASGDMGCASVAVNTAVQANVMSCSAQGDGVNSGSNPAQCTLDTSKSIPGALYNEIQTVATKVGVPAALLAAELEYNGGLQTNGTPHGVCYYENKYDSGSQTTFSTTDSVRDANGNVIREGPLGTYDDITNQLNSTIVSYLGHTPVATVLIDNLYTAAVILKNEHDTLLGKNDNWSTGDVLTTARGYVCRSYTNEYPSCGINEATSVVGFYQYYQNTCYAGTSTTTPVPTIKKQ